MSFVPRLYLSSAAPDHMERVLEESASRYLVKVLRMKEGDRFGGFDSQGRQYELVLKKAELPHCAASVLSCQDPPQGPGKLSLTLAQSLPKSSKMDLIFRQGTELGVHRFIPLLTQRSISRPEVSQYGHKNDRWNKILVEACRQCGRNDLPQLEPVTAWMDLLATFGDYDQVLLPYEKEAPTLKSVLESKPQARKILVLVGPEGGWAPEEVREAGQKEAASVHLPTPILRTETAGLAVISMVQFFFGSK